MISSATQLQSTRFMVNLNPMLNDTSRLITGCLKPTNTHSLYILAGITHQTSGEWWQVEWTGNVTSPTQDILFMDTPELLCLKFQRSFVTSGSPLTPLHQQCVNSICEWIESACSTIPPYNGKVYRHQMY